MQQRELRAWHGDAHLRVRRLERLDQVPGDDAARELASGDPEHTLSQALGADAPQETAQTDVRADEAQLAVDLRELQVVHAHDLRAVGIDDLLVEQVAAE